MISLIIPFYNEEGLVESAVNTAVRVLASITNDFEIICVDDGSRDRTPDLLLELRLSEPRIKVLVLSRNFGHQSAYTAGMSYARGDHIALMDGDLQDPPELLKPMYEKLIAEKLDVVYGKRTARDEPPLKRMLIKVFHKAFETMSHLAESQDVGNFSIFTRRVLVTLLSLQEKNRYLPGLRFFVGFQQAPYEYHRADRCSGAARMSYRQLFRLAVDALFSFSDFPIKMCLYLGLLGILTFSAGFLYTLISKLVGIAPFGWSSTVFSIYFLGSVQLVFLGILGEYVYRIYKEIQNRPIFIIKDIFE